MEAAFVRSTFLGLLLLLVVSLAGQFCFVYTSHQKEARHREGREKWALMIPVFSFLSATIAASFEFITYVMLFEFE